MIAAGWALHVEAAARRARPRRHIATAGVAAAARTAPGRTATGRSCRRHAASMPTERAAPDRRASTRTDRTARRTADPADDPSGSGSAESAARGAVVGPSAWPRPTMPEPASRISSRRVASSRISRHGVLQPWPIDAAVAQGTEPRTPRKVIRMATCVAGRRSARSASATIALPSAHHNASSSACLHPRPSEHGA